jgi:hypothetical protein
MSKYNLRCPRCGAPPERAKLKVISGRFVSEMPLAEDGFWPLSSKKWDTEDEIVRCSSCTTVFSLYECLPMEQIAHIETIEIRGLEEMGVGVLRGFMLLLGVLMDVVMIRVRTNENHIQVVEGAPFAQDLYNHMVALSIAPSLHGPRKPGFSTTQIQGHDGEWVLFAIPQGQEQS